MGGEEIQSGKAEGGNTNFNHEIHETHEMQLTTDGHRFTKEKF
jgi:hypothetical protein